MKIQLSKIKSIVKFFIDLEFEFFFSSVCQTAQKVRRCSAENSFHSSISLVTEYFYLQRDISRYIKHLLCFQKLRAQKKYFLFVFSECSRKFLLSQLNKCSFNHTLSTHSTWKVSLAAYSFFGKIHTQKGCLLV